MNPTQEELRRAKEAIIALLSIALVVEINAILTFYFIEPDNSAFIPIIITFVLAFIVVIISLFLYKKAIFKEDRSILSIKWFIIIHSILSIVPILIRTIILIIWLLNRLIYIVLFNATVDNDTDIIPYL